ncbi:MAG TPA: CRTAC1 family protein [Chthonomonadaceae bacterium]|nr:CRTAC1 family protein [Chthonomonadaceae bacterium]
MRPRKYHNYFGLIAILTLGILLAGCPGCNHQSNTTTTTVKPVTAPMGITFTDVTHKAGIDFHHVNGGFGNKWLPETMGSGLAWIDYDGDGYPDLFLVNSRYWTPAEIRSAGLNVPSNYPPGPMPTCKLYHNNRDGTFTDVTRQAHLDIPMYGMGVCVGDYDNDGHPDLYVTALDRNYLFHNNGDGTFTDRAEQADLKDGGWSTSCAWVDYNKDGKLDLVVCHYVDWSPKTDIAFYQGGHRHYGRPQQYTGEPLALYRNDGNGHFTNVTRLAGLLVDGDGRKIQGKSLGVAICDYDGDGWPDIAVANDTEPNYLFHNDGNGTFKEVGVETGMAYSDNAVARGAMGIDADDYDRSGRESLLIGNFSNQMLALYHNEGNGIFRDVAPQKGIGQPSLLKLSFGCLFADLNNDGWPDLLVANGHIDDDVNEVQKQVEYQESPLIFRNLGNGSFEDVSSQLGPDIQRRIVGRGLAYADYDLDGFLDVAISTNNGPAYLFHNSGNGNHSLRLELEGTKSNRSAIGAAILVKVGGTTQSYHVRSGSSYCSQSELPVTVGLGPAPQADSITIQWPSGLTTSLTSVAAGQIYKVVEGKGIVSQRPFKHI